MVTGCTTGAAAFLVNPNMDLDLVADGLYTNEQPTAGKALEKTLMCKKV